MWQEELALGTQLLSAINRLLQPETQPVYTPSLERWNNQNPWEVKFWDDKIYATFSTDFQSQRILNKIHIWVHFQVMYFQIVPYCRMMVCKVC